MRKNISLTAPSSSFVHCSLSPWCLKAGLEKFSKYKHNIDVISATVNEDLNTVAKRIIDTSPDILGICCYIWNIAFLRELLPMLKAALPNCIFVAGGPELLSDDAFDRLPEADYIILGEGEIPFAKLVDMLIENKTPDNIDGVMVKGASHVDTYYHYDIPVMPYDESYFKQLKGRISYIESSRGCPFSCTFCLSGRREKVRYLPMEDTKKRILMLANGGSKTIKFVDRTFNANKKRAKEIISFIMDKHKNGEIPQDICFHFEMAGDLIDNGIVELFSQSPEGLFQIEVGIQSLNEATLEAIQRKTDVEKIKTQLEKIISLDTVRVHVDLIAGLPLETLDSFIDAFNKVFAIKPHILQLGFLKILYGSKMRSQTEEFGIIYNEQPPYEVISTKHMSKKDMLILKRAERALELLYNRRRFVNTMQLLAGKMPAFDLFLALGDVILAKEKEKNSPLSLEELTEAVYSYLIDKMPEYATEIKSAMLYDRLSSTATSFIPHCLRSESHLYNKLKDIINKKYPKEKNIHRAIAVTGNDDKAKVFWADYSNKHPVTEHYKVNCVYVKELLTD
ncbi:MAG: B12-binding domain-containing radical SAM protein [Christensenellaceae bacterium]|nr:B12-binding domain-containing radical SAM protein [Christensenellaceae bacterium]